MIEESIYSKVSILKTLYIDFFLPIIIILAGFRRILPPIILRWLYCLLRQENFMIKTLLSRLLPREQKFYVLLEKLATLAQTSAQQLQTWVESTDDAHRGAAAKGITACKVEAKALAGTVTKELCLTFITPFDREDIQDFSFSLYKIIKNMDKVRQRLEMHALAHERGDFSRQIDLIVREAAAMQDMVHELTTGGHNARRILDQVAVMQDLENKGDLLLGELMASLFKEERHVRDLILRKDVYDSLEKVIDRYRDAAGIALQIVLKNS
jgi:uncharacterized protein Yka (UPF0111/DUF47 family)